jgi:hypothetical protein
MPRIDIAAVPERPGSGYPPPFERRVRSGSGSDWATPGG